jgi:hypothetical protein
MATFDFNDIFAQYYSLYRGEADTPASTDDEYTVALALSKEAITRWANYDGTYWKELFTTLGSSAQVSPALVRTVATGDSTYVAPTDFREAGGFVKLKDSDGFTVQSYGILEPEQVQFRNDLATYAYFTGDPNNGYTLHLNPAPDASLNGLTIDYTYYKKPTYFTTGTDKTEMADPMFIVHRMLANRFRVSRNPYYNSAKIDAEDCLKTMQADNNSGNWANPWQLVDNSGSVWGA